MIDSFSETWIRMLRENISDYTYEPAPRGRKTLEIPQRTITVKMRQPVLMVASRKLNYKFMGAEAHWILDGSNKVEDIAPFNPNIAKFSDDGEVFFGAYGPKIADQIDYVVGSLLKDRDSRQAGINIWRENPPPTKDVPCTVSMFFNIRNTPNSPYRLNMHVFMRSSDIWLGIPYDVFNFSMVAHKVCAIYNTDRRADTVIEPGVLFLTAASSHLYADNVNEAIACVNIGAPEDGHRLSPDELYLSDEMLMKNLKELRTSKPGHEARWWEQRP